jgi:hypothetical protein
LLRMALSESAMIFSSSTTKILLAITLLPSLRRQKERLRSSGLWGM